MPNSIYALILAGGSGERFWPLSRRARPKQLLRLVSNKTLLEETLARLDGLIPAERILILTNTEQEGAVRKLLGDFPNENIVAEPAKRDTAAAVALGTGWENPRAICELRSEEHTSELQSQSNLVCRLLLEKIQPSLTGCFPGFDGRRPVGHAARARIAVAQPVAQVVEVAGQIGRFGGRALHGLLPQNPGTT